MAPLPFLRTLCTLLLPTCLVLAHMQMEEPSPLRDPHSNRPSEPKDFNILTPLKRDGSDFSCKGYQWSTPLTPVRTYYAGETYDLRLKGGATHGGGSCQIGLSCNYGVEFKVLKSIIGGCPEEKEYRFRIPEFVRDGVCLLSWTWFNRIGNREMYMNCAVVNIRSAESKKRMKRRQTSGDGDFEYGDYSDYEDYEEYGDYEDYSDYVEYQDYEDNEDVYDDYEGRDSEEVDSVSAQAALASLPNLYVANLEGINTCVTKETVDLVFDNPGEDVVYGKDTKLRVRRDTASSQKCTGVAKGTGEVTLVPGPGEPIPDEAPTSNEPSTEEPAGEDGKWHGDDQDQDQEDEHSFSVDDGQTYDGDGGENQNTDWSGDTGGSEKPTMCNDGQWHPECYGLPPKDISNDKSEQYYEKVESTKEDVPTVSGTTDEDEVGGGWYWHDPDMEGDVPDYERRVQTREIEDDEGPTSIPETGTESIWDGWDGFLAGVKDGVEDDEDELLEDLMKEQSITEPAASTAFTMIITSAGLDTSSAMLTIKTTSTTMVTVEVPLETGGLNFEDMDGLDALIDPIPNEPSPKYSGLEDDVYEDLNEEFDQDLEEELNNLDEIFDEEPTDALDEDFDDELDQELDAIPAFEDSIDETDIEEFIAGILGDDSNLPSELFSEDSPSDVSSDDFSDVPFLNLAKDLDPSVCKDITPVTSYVSPDAAWFAEHTPPPSLEDSEQCERPVWKCAGCRSPNRCIKINECTRSCTRRPSPTPTSTEPPQSSSSSSPSISESTSSPSPSPSSGGWIPLEPACTLKPFAGDNPNSFLPCKPGTFLCKSPTQFYVCGQFGGTPEWSYGALRDVAEGMICEPNIIRGAAKRDLALLSTLPKRQSDFVPASNTDYEGYGEFDDEYEEEEYDPEYFAYEEGGNGVGDVEDIIAWFGDDVNEELRAVQEEAERLVEEAEWRRVQQEEIERQWKELEDAYAALEAERLAQAQAEAEEAAANDAEGEEVQASSESPMVPATTPTTTPVNDLAAVSTPAIENEPQPDEPLKLVDPDAELTTTQKVSISELSTSSTSDALSTSSPASTATPPPPPPSITTSPPILPDPVFLPGDDPNGLVTILPIDIPAVPAVPLEPGFVWPEANTVGNTPEDFADALARDKIANSRTIDDDSDVGDIVTLQKRVACGASGKLEPRRRLKKTGDWKRGEVEVERVPCPKVPEGYYRDDRYVRKV